VEAGFHSGLFSRDIASLYKIVTHQPFDTMYRQRLSLWGALLRLAALFHLPFLSQFAQIFIMIKINRKLNI